MINSKEIKIEKWLIRKKYLWTLLILLVYMVGRDITLPYAQEALPSVGKNFYELINYSTGGNLASQSLFSLGIGPWMSAIVIFSILSMVKRLGLQKIPVKRQRLIQMFLTLIISVIQGLPIALTMKLSNDSLMAHLSVFIVLLGGAFFLAWLSNMNSILGIGGASIIILINILVSFGEVTLPIFKIYWKKQDVFWIFVILISIVTILIVAISVFFEKSEYRIPLKRLMVTNNYGKNIYLPIKATPAGAMPVMFGMSLVIIPQYLIQLLLHFFPKNDLLVWLFQNTNLTSYFGVSLYVLIIFLLAIAFAYINVNPSDMAENLQKSGDYIENVRFGKPTEKYIDKYVKYFAIIGGIIITLIAACPLYYGVDYPYMQLFMMMPGNVMLSTTFVLSIIDQIRTLHLRFKYKDIL